MSIITIAREYGSGGLELGSRLADALGFAYYDREIITTIAQNTNMDSGYVERALDNPVWKRSPLMFLHTFSNPSLFEMDQTSLLLEQKKVIEAIAAKGEDCVIVGRNADVILAGSDYPILSVFVCADLETRIRRCIEDLEENKDLSRKEIEQKIHAVDKNRARAREMITGGDWDDYHSYDLVVNTSAWERIADLTPAVAEFARAWFAKQN